MVFVPLAAGAIMLAWPLVWLVAWGIGTVECWPGGQVPTDVMAWSLMWLVIAMLTATVAAGSFAARSIPKWALTGTLVTIAAIALGAELGWAVAMGLAGCDRGDEGPALALILFTVPAAVAGYAAGWLWRRSAR